MSPEKQITGHHSAHFQNLSANELRKRYPSEANTHRNMLQRGATQGRVIHPAFGNFRDFIIHVGPKPCPSATLDRIDNLDPEYGPGKVRWADKRTQNSNKGDTLLFYYSRTGNSYTVSRLAKLRKVSQGTIRKRRERGWTDDEIIEGKRRPAPVVLHPSHHAPRRHYLPEHEAPARRQSSMPRAADVLFERNRRYVQWYREEFGEELCWDDYETARKFCAEEPGAFLLTQEMFERRWLNLWKEHGPHMMFERLPQWAQELIEKIDPAGAAAARERARTTAELRELL